MESSQSSSSQSVIRQLSQSVQAIQKRRRRVVHREKKRRSFFVHDYVRTKYPGIFNEANGMYQKLVEKYPTKTDFCKTYYFKKWQKKIDEDRSDLMHPYIPVQLISNQNLHKYCSKSTPQNNKQDNQQTTQNNEKDNEQTAQNNEQDKEQVIEQVIEEVIEQGTQHNGQDDEQVETNTQEFAPMSIDELDRAVDQIITSLQADEQLRDMLSDTDVDFDLPDYVLENELDW